MQFISLKHKMKYVDLLVKSGIDRNDYVRMALFYLIASQRGIYSNINLVYDLSGNYLVYNEDKVNHQGKGCNNDSVFCKGEELLIKLGRYLYNGYTDGNFNPMDVFHYGEDIRFIAINAILLRYQSALIVNQAK